MSTQAPTVSHNRLWPTWVTSAALGLEEGEAAPPLGDTDPLGEVDDEADGELELPPVL